MAAVISSVQPDSEKFRENRESMLALVDRLRDLEQRARDQSNKRIATFEKRGQIPPHERLNRLLDPGMPFLQLHTMANFCVEIPDPDVSIPGASMLVGIGFIEGVRCMVWVDDSGIAAGAATAATVDVALSLQSICLRQKLPLVHL